MKQDQLFLIAASSFVLVIIWVGFNLYHAHADSTITETQNIQVVPISPQFNRGAIEILKNRTKVEPLFESSQAPVASSTPTITVTPSAVATSSAVKAITPTTKVTTP